MLEPYNLQIEEIDKDKNTTSLLAEKPSGSTEISWKEDNISPLPILANETDYKLIGRLPDGWKITLLVSAAVRSLAARFAAKEAALLAEQLGMRRKHLSLTHTNENVMAVVILEGVG